VNEMAVEAKNVRATDSVAKYYRELKAEFKKITWAPRDEVFRTTGVVLSTLVLFTVILWLYDSGFGVFLRWILQLMK
jgi:preprotein translocase subunit SecE